MSVLKGYYPEDVFSYFEAISAIPRGSGNERAVADYIDGVCRAAGLYVVQDEYHNVFVRKSAKAGFEDFPAVLLQGHTDMVCEKDADSTHDFLCDPLDLRVKDGFLYAEGTTLGADDGVAVAMMLAVLTDPTLDHGTVECLFTVDEERGMTGAEHFDYSLVSARRVINLDSEAEGECIVSCAGGADVTYTFENEYIPNVHPTARIVIDGLAGGHSGADIHRAHYNANTLMARFLFEEYERKPFGLIDFAGGDKHNVIPTACTALISCDHIDALRERAAEYQHTLRANATDADRGVRVRVDKKGVRPRTLGMRQTYRLLCAALLAPSGVLDARGGDPIASSNLGVVRTQGENSELAYLLRYNAADLCTVYTEKYRALADLLGCACRVDGEYSCWERRRQSPLADAYADTYRKLYGGREARITGMHAGVECGHISHALPDADIISIGPDIFDIHTPHEHADILSVGRTYGLLLKLICRK